MSEDQTSAESTVIDFQTEALGRMRARMTALNASHAELLAHSRGQQAQDGRIFTAVLAALDADGLDHLIHIVTADWVDMLEVDAIVLALESGGQRFTMTGTGIQLLPADGLGEILPDGLGIRINAVESGHALFGPAAPLVRQQALARIGTLDGALAGLLLMGSRNPARFADHGVGAGLGFLAAVVERCLVRWLNQRP